MSFFVKVVRNVFDCREAGGKFGGIELNKQASIIQRTGLPTFPGWMALPRRLKKADQVEVKIEEDGSSISVTAQRQS